MAAEEALNTTEVDFVQQRLRQLESRVRALEGSGEYGSTRQAATPGR